MSGQFPAAIAAIRQLNKMDGLVHQLENAPLGRGTSFSLINKLELIWNQLPPYSIRQIPLLNK